MPFDPAALTVTHARVDLDALRHNARVLQRLSGRSALRAVVKADAYGHGAVAVARTLQQDGVARFAVATVPEAIALREGGIDGSILVFATPFEAFLPAYEAYKLDASVTSIEACRGLAAYPSPLRLHLKIDTGMHRLGVLPQDVPEALRCIAASPHQLEALWTHYASADEEDSLFTGEQLTCFDEVRRQAPEVPVHLSNSASIVSGRGALPEADEVRAGLALYGLMHAAERETSAGRLREAMQFVSRVVSVRRVPAGETVSYGRAWTASRDTHVATIGAGYADGVRRALTNLGAVGVRGTHLPIIGKVCMDAFMVDAGDASEAPRVRVGEEVVLFGPGGPSAAEVADWLGTIAYEVACGVGARVPRIYAAF